MPYISKNTIYILAFILGSLINFAFYPYNFTITLIMAFCGLLYLIYKSPKTTNYFALGWWFGFGKLTLGLYWISESLLIEADKFGYLIPFAITLIPAILAIFPAIAIWTFAKLKQGGASDSLILGATWVGCEIARSTLILDGFGWNSLGYIISQYDEVIQLASITGVYGLSFIVVILTTNFYYFGQHNKYSGLSILIILTLLIFFGKIRLTAPTAFSDTAIRIVQPNIAQKLKWKKEERMHHFNKQLFLSRHNVSGLLHFVIWPEATINYNLMDKRIRDMIAQNLPSRANLILGGIRQEKGKVYNSVFVIDKQGDIIGWYDKHYLVPFGEYIPLFDNLSDYLGIAFYENLSFSPGTGPTIIKLPQGHPSVRPLICYEVMFNQSIVSRFEERPQWLVNLTNDAWFGDTLGPYQHFAISKLRAIEQGLPLVRAANTGISALFDAYGRVVSQLDLNTEGTIDAFLPKPASPTLFSKYGNGPMLLLIFLLLMQRFPIRELPLLPKDTKSK